MEHRIWHVPIVRIMNCVVTPDGRCSAKAYDKANRRWYRLDVDSVVKDDEWMSNIVTKHIEEYYGAHMSFPSWNTIQTTSSGTPVTFTTSPDKDVAREILTKLNYGNNPVEKLPTILSDEVRERLYLDRCADYCVWNGTKCIFKVIEFDRDVQPMTREIRMREALMLRLASLEDRTPPQRMMDEFHIMPILAVVTDGTGPRRGGNVLGIIMPFIGETLEVRMANSPSYTVDVTEQQLKDLVRAVSKFSARGIVHGNIKYWNTILEDPVGSGRQPRLILIDLSSMADDYKGDTKAMAELVK